MPELALHILDLVQNSISAGAARVIVTIAYVGEMLCISIEDDGAGMDAELLRRVASPFATTRKTRKVGLGIPMFQQLAEMCGGGLEIASEPGKGTALTARFLAEHLDLPPMGDLAGTIKALLIACPERPEFRLVYRRGEREFALDTAELREILGGLPLNEPEILSWIGSYLDEGIHEINSSN